MHKAIAFTRVTGRASDNDVIGLMRSTPTKRNDMIDMVNTISRLRTPTAQAALIRVLVLYITLSYAFTVLLLRPVFGAIRTEQFWLSGAQPSQVVALALAVFLGVLAIILSQPFDILVAVTQGFSISFRSMLAIASVPYGLNLFRVIAPKAVVYRTRLFGVILSPLSVTLKDFVLVVPIVALGVGFAASLTPRMKTIRLCAITMKEAWGAGKFKAAFSAAFEGYVFSHGILVNAARILNDGQAVRVLLFGSDPIPSPLIIPRIRLARDKHYE